MEVGSGEGEGTRASACLSNRRIRRRDDVYAYAIAAISGIALFCSLPAAAGRHARARERIYARKREVWGAGRHSRAGGAAQVRGASYRRIFHAQSGNGSDRSGAPSETFEGVKFTAARSRATRRRPRSDF